MNTFTDAVRDDTSLLIAIAGASGSGKTYSALKMATGLAQGEPIYAIDTEAKRMLHYAEQFKFKHMDMKPPFTPEAFADGIAMAEKAGAKAIIIDSMSDEYEGMGGLQEMHDEEIARLARKPYDRLEGWELDKFNAPAWKIPKTRHKVKLISRLRQIRAYVIFCLRAEEKIKFVKVRGDDGREKTAIQNAGWVPICEKKFMYDATLSFTVTPDNPGVPLIEDGVAVYGKIQNQHLPFFPAGKRVTEECGLRLRQWARGESSSVQSISSPTGGAGTVESSQTVPADPSLLAAYHARLAGEAFKDDLAAAHAEFKPKFDGQPAAIMEAAKRIFNAHKDRIAGNSDSESTAGYVQGFIDEVAA
jgi:hypothetical protein